MSHTEAIPMASLPSHGLAVSGPWTSKPQLKSYISLGYEADTENESHTSAKKHKGKSRVDYSDPMDQQRFLWSWPNHVQYQDTRVQGTSPKTASPAISPAQKTEDHTSRVAKEVPVLSDAEKDRDPPFRFGSPAPKTHRKRTPLQDLGETLNRMDENEDLKLEPSDRPSAMPFLRVNRECFTGNFKHYCANDVGDDASEMSIGIPLYPPIADSKTTGVLGDGVFLKLV
ncbi:hypothetical protein MMC30_000098 [Trapelia coarctata]|nr:hypothetical protein [Trapelia coarctata]